MDNYSQALYALKRQKLAVERTLGARSNEECVVASRWVSAWQKLVQAKLDRTAAASGSPSNSTSNSASSASISARPTASRYVDRAGRLLH